MKPYIYKKSEGYNSYATSRLLMHLSHTRGIEEISQELKQELWDSKPHEADSGLVNAIHAEWDRHFPDWTQGMKAPWDGVPEYPWPFLVRTWMQDNFSFLVEEANWPQVVQALKEENFPLSQVDTVTGPLIHYLRAAVDWTQGEIERTPSVTGQAAQLQDWLRGRIQRWMEDYDRRAHDDALTNLLGQWITTARNAIDWQAIADHFVEEWEN